LQLIQDQDIDNEDLGLGSFVLGKDKKNEIEKENIIKKEGCNC
jgi:hypothetical protein